MHGVKIFRFDGALHFASFDYFVSKLVARTGLNARRLSAKAANRKKVSPESSNAPADQPPLSSDNPLNSSDAKSVKIPKSSSNISLESDDDEDASPMPQFPGAISLASTDGETSIPQFPGAVSLLSIDAESAPILNYPGAVSLASVDTNTTPMPKFPGATSLVSSDGEAPSTATLTGAASVSNNNNEDSENSFGFFNLGSSVSLTTLSACGANSRNALSTSQAAGTSKDCSAELQNSGGFSKLPESGINPLSTPKLNAVIDITVDPAKSSSLEKANFSESDRENKSSTVRMF